jgi:transposase
MFKTFHRRQVDLLPPSLEELIPADDLLYTVIATVDLLDLRTLYEKFSRLGQNAYHPKMLLGVIFYAYTQGIFSSRRIAEHLCYDVRYMYLAGKQRPDFRTLSDFRKDHRLLLKDYFRQILSLCRQAGILLLRQVAIDGSKISASASSRRTLSRAELARRLEATEAEIEGLLQAAESADAAEDQAGDPDSPADLKSLSERRRRLQQAQEDLKAKKGQAKINLTDPDCRAQKGIGPGYNGQIAVDADSQIIVGAQVVSDPNDTHQLGPMIRELESSSDSVAEPKTVIADSGYASAAGLAEIEKLPHVEAYVPTRAQVHEQRDSVPPFDKRRFQYDLKNRTATCPQGQALRFLRRGINKSGQAYVNFIGTACPACPVRSQCTKAKYRHLVVLLAEPLLEQMESKMDSAAGVQAMRVRKSTVEPVWGILKEQLGFRRFHLRGLEKVNAEFTLLCTAFNLRKLHRLLTGRRLTEALAAAALRPQKVKTELLILAYRWLQFVWKPALASILVCDT